MKKSLVAICMALVLVMCLPSVSVSADVEIKIYNSEWLSDYYSGDNNYDYLFGWDNSLATNLPLAEQALEDFETNYSQPYYIATFNYNGENWVINFLCSQSPIIMFFGGPIYYDTRTTMVPSWWTTNSSIMIYSYVYNSLQHSFNVSSWSNTDYNGTKFVFSGNSLYCFAFKGENYALSLAEINSGGALNSYLSGNSIIPGNQDPIYRNVLSRINVSDYFNYLQPDMPYYNGTEVIDPNGETVESNINHMYFNSCQLGFCEPYGVSNFSSFGGAYFYAKYSIDEWVRNHITDYSLYFYATAYVDSRQYSGSTEVRLDNDGCITIPFSDIFTSDGGVISDGFLAYISPNLVEQSFYDTSLYSVNKEQVQSFIDQRNILSQDDWDRAWEDLYELNSGQPVGNPGFGAIGYLSNNFSSLLNGTISSSIINSINNHTNFKIHVNCYLKDNSGNVSGTVGKMFDLKVGNNFSTNNEGLTNNDPYIETDLPSDYVPSIISDNNGYSLSGIGNNNQIVNFSSPDQIKLFIYSGLEEFITWYNSDPSTSEVSTGFWNTFGLFRNNPAADLYEAYFGFLPTSFKDIILGCATIGIVGGVFCALRRKFT